MLKPVLWYIIYKLSEINAHLRFIMISTKSLAKMIGISQQSVSRYLIELEKIGYIKRNVSFQGIELRINKEGIRELREFYFKLKNIFEETEGSLFFEGKVFSGLGEGAYYIGLKGYRQHFLNKLGFKPYKGTLNLRLSPINLNQVKEIEFFKPIVIDGYETKGRSFGPVRCFPAKINNKINGAVILIDRTHHDDSVIEIIAPFNLRKKLKLEDGSVVSVIVYQKY